VKYPVIQPHKLYHLKPSLSVKTESSRVQTGHLIIAVEPEMMSGTGARDKKKRKKGVIFVTDTLW
jgi:hypothetical protein